MTRLLVSVRSAEEASAALAGGADVIDVKEPAHGPLGRADPAAVQEIVAAVGGRCPVSVALGELVEAADALPRDRYDLRGVAFLKAGLSRCVGKTGRDLDRLVVSVSERLNAATELCLGVGRGEPPAGVARADAWPGGKAFHADVRTPVGCGAVADRWVAVAYADWQRAAAPPPEHVAQWAAARGWRALLVDTWQKDGTTLLSWLRPAELAALCAPLRRAGVLVALAGSLGPEEIERLLPLKPDFVAVRGAACRARARGGAVEAEMVARLAAVVSGGGGRRGRKSA